MRLLYDSTRAADVPADSPMVAGYCNGRYVSWPALKARFPVRPCISISVDPHDPQLAHVLDVERGDATPAEFYPWATSMANRGVLRPTAYCSRSSAAFLLSLRPHGVTVDLWIADWTGSAHQVRFAGANVVAVQFGSPGRGAGGHYDVSAVWDDAWHRG